MRTLALLIALFLTGVFVGWGLAIDATSIKNTHKNVVDVICKK